MGSLILELALLAAIIGLGLLLILLIAVLAKILSAGPSEISRLNRQGFGLWAYLSGNIPKQDGGANIDVIEGIEIRAKGRRLSTMRQTRALSDELI
jgi:hypothetical protein